MTVICNSNSGKTLASRYLARGYTAQSEFGISIDREYAVFGTALWQSLLLFLISDDNSLPNWYPADLFSIKDGKLGSDWFFNAYAGNEDGLQAIWGYDALVHDDTHYDALLERNPEAMKVFYLERAKLVESD